MAIGKAQKFGHLARDAFSWSYPSLSVPVVTLPAVAADVALPNIVVAGLPVGGAVVLVRTRIKARQIENTAGGGANALVGDQNIRIKADAGGWGVDDIAAIPLPDNYWAVAAASTISGGDVVLGVDVSSVVVGNGTYNLRFEDALVDLASLVLNDVQLTLEIWYR
jgi:hypothetical protein